MDNKKYAETYVQELVANSTFECAIATRGLAELNPPGSFCKSVHVFSWKICLLKHKFARSKPHRVFQ